MRYVVLHHEQVATPHYDLMFEKPDGRLKTFRAECWPVRGEAELLELTDHRAAYLDYEGPISGGRGSVRRIESGEYRSEPGWEIDAARRTIVIGQSVLTLLCDSQTKRWCIRRG